MKKIIFVLALLLSPSLVLAQKTLPSFSERLPSTQLLAGNVAAGISFLNFSSARLPSLSAVSVRYWIDDKIAVDAQAGLGFGDAADYFYGEVKAVSIIKNYGPANVYIDGFGGFGGYEGDAIVNVGAGAGFEWFVTNNISLSAEVGFSFFDVGGNVNQISLYASWFPQAGIRLYL